MASPRLLFVFCSIFLHVLALTIAQQDTPLQNICVSDQGNFTTNSTYETNLKHLLSSLTSNNKIDYGFYNASYGQNSDQVNAIALCRGDVKTDSCRSCIRNSILELPKVCPYQKEANIWYDNCMLRYSSRYFFGNMEFGPWFYMYNWNNVSDANNFNQAVKTLLGNLKNQAASGDSRRKFATGQNTSAPNSQTIYALVQCTPDLSEAACRECLSNVTELLPDCCNGRRGGRVLSPSCNFRYEINRFYEVAADAPTKPPSPSVSPSPATSPPSSASPSPTTSASPSPATSPPPSVSPSPATSPPPSVSPSPETSPPPPPPLAPASQPPASPDASPPPPSASPDSSPITPPASFASQKGKMGHDSSTFVLILVPLLVSQYLSSLPAFF